MTTMFDSPEMQGISESDHSILAASKVETPTALGACLSVLCAIIYNVKKCDNYIHRD